MKYNALRAGCWGLSASDGCCVSALRAGCYGLTCLGRGLWGGTLETADGAIPDDPESPKNPKLSGFTSGASRPFAGCAADAVRSSRATLRSPRVADVTCKIGEPLATNDRG